MMQLMCFVIIAIIAFGAIVQIYSIAFTVVAVIAAVLVLVNVLLCLRSENWFGA